MNNNRNFNYQSNISSDLINKYIINSDLFKDFCFIIKNKYIQINKHFKIKKKSNTEEFISLNDFEKLIQELIIMIMKSYLKGTEYEQDDCLCIIKKIGIFSGYFDSENNLIVISKHSIDKIYQGDIVELSVLFHELNHFKIKYDIKLGKNDENIKRILKEKLIRQCGFSYYNDNYKFESEEVYVDILGILDLLTFTALNKIKITKNDIKRIIENLSQNMERYRNYRRNIESLDINDCYLDFRDVFDLLITYHPEWLIYSQIKEEYYEDEKGKILKINQNVK